MYISFLANVERVTEVTTSSIMDYWRLLEWTLKDQWWLEILGYLKYQVTLSLLL